MSFRLVAKSVTLNYLERRNGVILRYFSEFGYLPGVLRKSSRSLSHLLMSSCYCWNQLSHSPGQQTTHKKCTLKVHSPECLLIYCQLVYL